MRPHHRFFGIIWSQLAWKDRRLEETQGCEWQQLIKDQVGPKRLCCSYRLCLYMNKHLYWFFHLLKTINKKSQTAILKNTGTVVIDFVVSINCAVLNSLNSLNSHISKQSGYVWDAAGLGVQGRTCSGWSRTLQPSLQKIFLPLSILSSSFDQASRVTLVSMCHRHLFMDHLIRDCW